MAFKKSFTIVELIVVIVVIAILEAVTIVAYNGINRRVAESALKSSLHNAATQLASDNALAGVYPSSQIDANQGRGLAAQKGTNFEYTYNASTNSYCLTARSTSSDITPQHIESANAAVQSGACP